MTTSTTILWGIDRPDGSPVHKSPQFGSSFWRSKDGQYGQPDHEDGARHAEIAAQELTDALIRQGVRPEDAKHRVVRIVVETNVRREVDWTDEVALSTAQLDMDDRRRVTEVTADHE